MDNWGDFIEYIENHKNSFFKIQRTCVEMTSNFVYGHILAQIIYWNLPNKDGETKLRAKRLLNGKPAYYLAKSHSDMHEEIGVGEKQYYNALMRLKENGFIKTMISQWDGHATNYIWLNRELVAEKYFKAKDKVEEEIEERATKRREEREMRVLNAK